MKKTVCLGFSVLVICCFFSGFAAAQNPAADWQKSKHSNKELAAHEATWEGRRKLPPTVAVVTANRDSQHGCRNCSRVIRL